MSKIKPTIKITRNCQNGEHVFIPALTHDVNLGADEHDIYVTAFVCQHCLYYVSDDVWAAHLHNSYSAAELEPEKLIVEKPVPLPSELKIVAQGGQGGAGQLPKKEEPKLPYPGKKRGPKPKQMDIPGTSK